MVSPIPRPIEVVGHGGAAAHHRPNSEASLCAAIAFGVDRIEIDLSLAADGTLVLHHGPSMSTTTQGSAMIAALTLEKLQRLQPDLLTIDDAAEIIGGRLPLLLDAKSPGQATAIAAAVARHRWTESAIVSSTHAATLRRLHGLRPELRLGLSTGHWAGSAPTFVLRPVVRAGFAVVLPLTLPAALALIGASDTMLRHESATQMLVHLLHRAGTRVNLFTLDDDESIQRAIGLGVDSIISNRPDLVLRLLGRGGHRPAPTTVNRATG